MAGGGGPDHVRSLEKAIGAKTVTYDFARLMEGAREDQVQRVCLRNDPAYGVMRSGRRGQRGQSLADVAQSFRADQAPLAAPARSRPSCPRHDRDVLRQADAGQGAGETGGGGPVASDRWRPSLARCAGSCWKILLGLCDLALARGATCCWGFSFATASAN